jgi:hypothetical protein
MITSRVVRKADAGLSALSDNGQFSVTLNNGHLFVFDLETGATYTHCMPCRTANGIQLCKNTCRVISMEGTYVRRYDGGTDWILVPEFGFEDGVHFIRINQKLPAGAAEHCETKASIEALNGWQCFENSSIHAVTARDCRMTVLTGMPPKYPRRAKEPVATFHNGRYVYRRDGCYSYDLLAVYNGRCVFRRAERDSYELLAVCPTGSSFAGRYQSGEIEITEIPTGHQTTITWLDHDQSRPLPTCYLTEKHIAVCTQNGNHKEVTLLLRPGLVRVWSIKTKRHISRVWAIDETKFAICVGGYLGAVIELRRLVDGGLLALSSPHNLFVGSTNVLSGNRLTFKLMQGFVVYNFSTSVWNPEMVQHARPEVRALVRAFYVSTWRWLPNDLEGVIMEFWSWHVRQD